jgi:hypothetical protein
MIIGLRNEGKGAVVMKCCVKRLRPKEKERGIKKNRGVEVKSS